MTNIKKLDRLSESELDDINKLLDEYKNSNNYSDEIQEDIEVIKPETQHNNSQSSISQSIEESLINNKFIKVKYIQFINNHIKF